MDDAAVCGSCGTLVQRGIQTCPACGGSMGGEAEPTESPPAERVPLALPPGAARRPLGGRLLLLGINLALLAVCAVLSATQYFFPAASLQHGAPMVTATPLLSGSGTETAVTGPDPQSVNPAATATPRPHQSGGGAPPTATVPAGPAPTATATRVPPIPTPTPTWNPAGS